MKIGKKVEWDETTIKDVCELNDKYPKVIPEISNVAYNYGYDKGIIFGGVMLALTGGIMYIANKLRGKY